MPRSRSYQAKLLEDLRAPEEAAEYLNAALEEGNRELFLLALRNVAEARGGLSKLAESTQLNRENLYRMLSDKGNPEFYSLYTLLDALGLRLAIEKKQTNPEAAVPPRVGGEVLVLRTRRAVSPSTERRLELAADTTDDRLGKIMVVTLEEKEIGTLEYDYQNAELYLDVRGHVPQWHTMDVEIRTAGGKQFFATTAKKSGSKLVLLQGEAVKKDQVEQITLKPRYE